VTEKQASGAERREHARRPLRAPTTVLLPGNQTFEARSLDISLGGMGIVAPASPKAGTRFRVRTTLQLPGVGPVPFEADVEVTHSIYGAHEGGFKVGLRFVSIEPHLEQALARFVL
jgi:c-di-GMP-binding flagellar brake protein YcgR